MESVKLIECFNSFQGEGVDSGKSAIILRFKHCNLRCPWCDTSVKMRISMEAEYHLSDIQNKIHETKSGLLITGGEPTIKRHFNETLSLLNNLEYPFANVESNGFNLETLIKNTDKAKPIRFIYSPKIFTEEDLESATYLTQTLLHLSTKVYIKVVYEDRRLILDYLEFLSQFIDGYSTSMSRYSKVWLMPEGVNRADLIKNSVKVFDACEKYKFNFSSREHIIYGFV